jgi:hypothetical protein
MQLMPLTSWFDAYENLDRVEPVVLRVQPDVDRIVHLFAEVKNGISVSWI